MLAIRRGSASFKVRSSTFSSLLSRPLQPRHLAVFKTGSFQASPTRPFQTFSRCRQQAAAAAYAEEPNIEDGTKQEVAAPRPPADYKINANANQEPITEFRELAERGMVCQPVVDTLTRDMGLVTMTEVQSLTINQTLKGIDVLAQARTGTGKTLAFLIPILQNIISKDPSLGQRSQRHGRRGTIEPDIRAIIISPTRELAEQIAVEAKKVTRNTGVIVQTAVGGTNKGLGLRKIKYEGCHILVGTPGRLNDLLSDPYSQVRAPNLSALALDEADRVLDQGFAPEIQNIQNLLPKRKDVDRQTLLFSATVPREVMQMVQKTMKRDYKFVRTVPEGEQQTHLKVPQRLVHVGGFENQLPALVELCHRELNQTDTKSPFKAIVYYSATADVSLASALMRMLQSRNDPTIPYTTTLVEMHARLDQRQRTRAAETFRNAKSAIMLSSDVTARGMDFPNVTHVIQIGLPPNEEQYVHRIGRTARGDKAGEGWLFVTDLEAREVRRKLSHMPLVKDTSLQTAQVDMKQEAQLPEPTAKILTKVAECTRMVPYELKAKSYMASLGIYAWVPRKQDLIDAMNNRSLYGWGMETPPAVGATLAAKLGLSKVQGINIGRARYSSDDSEDSRLVGDPGYGSRGYNRGGGSGFGRRAEYGSRPYDREGGSGFGRRAEYGSRPYDREGGSRFGGRASHDDRGRDREGGFGSGGRDGSTSRSFDRSRGRDSQGFSQGTYQQPYR